MRLYDAIKATYMLEQTLVNAGIGLLTGIIGSFIGFACWPWLRRCRIRRGLRVMPEPFAGTGGIWCRVANGSPFTMGKAIAYISIDHQLEDMMDPPQGRDAYNKRQDGVFLREGQLCWAVQEGGVNPMRVDIYSGEQQPLCFGSVETQFIEILSEKCHSPARVFLRRQKYKGALKVVCMDCEAKTFPFEIDPDEKNCPIKVIC
jgi:hypothetical protein